MSFSTILVGRARPMRPCARSAQAASTYSSRAPGVASLRPAPKTACAKWVAAATNPGLAPSWTLSRSSLTQESCGPTRCALRMPSPRPRRP